MADGSRTLLSNLRPLKQGDPRKGVGRDQYLRLTLRRNVSLIVYSRNRQAKNVSG